MDKKTIIKNSQKHTQDIKVTNKITNFWIPFSLMVPALIFFGLFTIIPLLRVAIDSTNVANLSDGGPFKYFFSSQGVWADSDWYYSMFYSMTYAAISVPLSLAISLAVAFAISNVVRKKARGFWQTIFFIPYVTSAIAVSLTFMHLLSSDQTGIINWIFGTNIPWLEQNVTDGFAGLWSMVIYGVWHGLAFQILILTTAMLSIDKRLYDAAAIDGASSKSMFFNITMPSVEKTVWYLFTIGLIASVKVFPLALFDNNTVNAMDKAPTMMVYVYSLLKVGTPNYGKAGAASISLIVVIISFNIFVKVGVETIQKIVRNSKEVKSLKEIQSIREQAMDKVYNRSESEKFIQSLSKAKKGGGK